eukprot:TRINITY_DN5049_c0_g1_i1.p1 TRINITY_DN5049_c0_g1~~TRINITY_DN5049_c0_g1_i1.p1  ORF type:complete len:1114 (+),score=306.55 TRINITY_DN5049_c0_g1_i1:135-3476(+)
MVGFEGGDAEENVAAEPGSSSTTREGPGPKKSMKASRVTLSQQQHEEDGEGDEDARGPSGPKKSVFGEAAMVDLSNQELNVNAFDEIRFEAQTVAAIRQSWNLFVQLQGSQEAAGEAIFSTIFDAAPSMEKMFNVARSLQALRFMNAIQGFLLALEEPSRLKLSVEQVGFGHLNFDITVPRVMVFRDAIIDLLNIELGDKLSEEGVLGWVQLLNYVGGAIVFCKSNYSERIQILLETWDKVREKTEEEEALALEAKDQEPVAIEVQEMTGRKRGQEGKEVAAASTTSTGKRRGVENVPTTYLGMFLFNAAVMGIDDRPWIDEVLACWEALVKNVASPARMQEEADVLALRINKIKANQGIVYNEYKSCMLSSLRSLLPKEWSNKHEIAWVWVWETVERLLKQSEIMKRGTILERALARLYDGIEEDEMYELRQEIYDTYFTSTPAGEDHFKQNNAYLHLIVEKVLNLCLEFYKDPVKVVDDVSSMGLRHVGYGIPTDLFSPYVTAVLQVFDNKEFEKASLDALKCSLTLLSKMMVRTIVEGSTLVMKAINNNSDKMLNKAIAVAPRAERAKWMLLVQVGTQSISPLEWAIKSGQHLAARAMLQDLLVIRADRDRYYFAKDELFARHDDLVGLLIGNAPDLLPVLLDGLIWRSTLNENGLRRVNYYIKHLLVNQAGERHDTFELIGATLDPKLVCHSTLIVIADIVWSRAVYGTFLMGKIWLFFTLMVFVCSQSIREIGELPEAVFGCRVFVYFLSMSQLIYTHVKKFIVSFQSGDVGPFGCLTLPNYLRDWREACSLALAAGLFIMFSMEPILQCWAENEGVMFNAQCSRSDGLRFSYSLMSCLSMILYYLLLMDLTVFSNRVSAYVLLIAQLASELGLFLLALAALLVTAASGFSCLEQDLERFKTIFSSAATLLDMFFRMLTPSVYEEMRTEPVVTLGCYAFLVCASVYLLNLLVAQLTCSYKSIFADMVGYARLGRIRIINDTMPKVSKKKWNRCIESLLLDEKLAFTEGDFGPSGGVQVLEPANLNPTATITIRRFGGTTSPAVQWPEEETAGDDEGDRIERLSTFISKTMATVAAAEKKRRKAKGGSFGSGMVDSHDTSGGASEGSDA